MKIWYTVVAATPDRLADKLNLCEELGLHVSTILSGQNAADMAVIVAYLQDSRRPRPYSKEEVDKQLEVPRGTGSEAEHVRA